MGPANTTPNLRELVGKLTLEEKVSLLSGVDWWRTARIERDGVFVPQLKTSDGPNGARGESYVSGVRAACFPSECNLGSTFDTELLYKVGQELAEETKSKSANVLLAPTMNVVRSPLGGRNHETYGEDPFLLGALGSACVNAGIQSRGVGATPKHYVANEAEDQRRTLDVQVSEAALREVYLYPFQLVMKNCDPWCFMTSYNRVQGEFVGASKHLIADVLRKEWGFKGMVISDWAGTYSCAEPVNAGMDLEMPGPSVQRGAKLLSAIADGKVTEETVTESALRVLELVARAGKWQDPTESPEREAIGNTVRDELICQAAAEGMVLLKNESSILPLTPSDRIAVIGQHASTLTMHGGGSARIFGFKGVTPVEGLQSAGFQLDYAPGVPVYNALPMPEPAVVSSSVEVPDPDAPVECKWYNSKEAGQDYLRTSYLKRPEYMIKESWPTDLNEVDYSTELSFIITPTTTGEHLIGVTTTGEADLFVDGQHVYHREQEMDLIFESYVFHKPALTKHTTYPMNAGQSYRITLHTKGTSPNAISKLRSSQLGSMTLLQGSSVRFFEAYSIPSRIAEAAALAASASTAVIFVGKNDEFESEGFDQASYSLPCSQPDLIDAVARANPRTVVVNFSGSPVDMPFADPSTPARPTPAAILQAWFPGQEAGHAIARVLAGTVNPCGRLASTFPMRIEDTPCYGNFPVGADGVLRYEEGRFVGYRHYDRPGAPKPRFPFGFGLSYTTFDIVGAGFERGKDTIESEADVLALIVKVKNTGSRPGKEVVQIYVAPPAEQVEAGRPVKELKGFVKVEVRAGEISEAKIPLDKYGFSFWDERTSQWRTWPGTYQVLIGTCSAKASPHSVKVLILGSFTWAS
ncbi:glycoside hydrolase superfamily [Lineolata rhizophorae]|uniref:beta-glucosidase n=1 Tax=Lineolata rhizophorae TaxID=578093 RepID=A0A6A6P4R0_9PEZI|nr:glycoside hydrolase superfamily [Lineolata rhizophorae]